MAPVESYTWKDAAVSAWTRSSARVVRTDSAARKAVAVVVLLLLLLLLLLGGARFFPFEEARS